MISLGPQRSTQKKTFQKSRFHDDKTFWHLSPRIIECDKPHETIYKGPQAILTIRGELMEANV